MAITTYAELQAAAASWLIRSDQTARIPDFIALAETRLNRVLRLRRAELDGPLTGVPASRFIPLPADYDEALTCWILYPTGTEAQELRFVDPAKLDPSTIAGTPRGWTIDGTNLGFERPCDQAYAFTLRYLAKLALSEAIPTNALLTDYPDVYLFATLAEAGAALRDNDFTVMYEGKLDRAIKEINAKDARSRAQQTLSTEPGQLQRMTRASGFSIYRGD